MQHYLRPDLLVRRRRRLHRRLGCGVHRHRQPHRNERHRIQTGAGHPGREVRQPARAAGPVRGVQRRRHPRPGTGAAAAAGRRATPHHHHHPRPRGRRLHHRPRLPPRPPGPAHTPHRQPPEDRQRRPQRVPRPPPGPPRTTRRGRPRRRRRAGNPAHLRLLEGLPLPRRVRPPPPRPGGAADRVLRPRHPQSRPRRIQLLRRPARRADRPRHGPGHDPVHPRRPHRRRTTAAAGRRPQRRRRGVDGLDGEDGHRHQRAGPGHRPAPRRRALAPGRPRTTRRADHPPRQPKRSRWRCSTTSPKPPTTP